MLSFNLVNQNSESRSFFKNLIFLIMNKKEDLTQIKNRLKELAKLIKLHNEHYHLNDKPIISDGEFDKLVNENSHLENTLI